MVHAKQVRHAIDHSLRIQAQPHITIEQVLCRIVGRIPDKRLRVNDERRDFLEICEDRYPMRSTILTSQLPVAKWHEQIGDPTLADSILDRLVHNAHRIEMRGESMRKKRDKER